MPARETTIEVGDGKHGLRMTLAAARALDPDGKLHLKDVLDRVQADREFLAQALYACLEGWRSRHAPTAEAWTVARAEALFDDAGYLKVYNAVTAALLGFYNPEVPGDPKAPEASSTAPGDSDTPVP